MAKQRKAIDERPVLRGIAGGKGQVRAAYEACADTTPILEFCVIAVPSAADEAYAAQVARLLAGKA